MGMGKENVSAEPHRSPDPVQTALPMTHMLLPYSCVLDPLPLVCYRMKDPARLRHYWRERESRYSVGTGNVDFAEGRCFPRIFFRLPWE